MPTFAESLQGKDLGHLQIIGNLWDIDLIEQDPKQAIKQLSSALVNADTFETMLSSLPGEAKTAMDDLAQHKGRLAWAQFSRQYGEVREMGAARRDREKPYDQPGSTTEILWYRGLVGRAFFDATGGVEEYAYIPDDLLELITPPPRQDSRVIARQAAALEYASICRASDQLLDELCSLLAALRLDISLKDRIDIPCGEVFSTTFAKLLLKSANLLDESDTPAPEPVRLFLDAKRGEALLQLYKAWKESTLINELAMLPDLVVEGNWQNDAVETRRVILDLLRNLEPGIWWSLESFVSSIKQYQPDFQRPAGDYDSWFIRQRSSGEYLRGFEHWDDVEGRLIRFILTGPLYWLGVVELGSPEEGGEIITFRLSAWSEALLLEQAPKRMPIENEPLIVRSDARISARRLVPRRVRYQLARFCDWEKETPEEYIYRISPESLVRARRQGLSVKQLINLLTRHSKAVPPSLISALTRWDQQGSEARLEKVVVLRVVSEEVLRALRKTRASRFLGESIGPMAVTIKPGAVDKVLGALAELGYLGEIRYSDE